MRLPRSLVALSYCCVLIFSAVSSQAADAPAPEPASSSQFDWRWRSLSQPCGGDCAVYFFAGSSVSTNVQDIFFKAIGPTNWHYSGGSIIGGAFERRLATVFNIIDIEGELGTAKRFGDQTEGEFWGAIYVRYIAFPWNNFIYTTFAVSTGLNYATGISDFEKAHSELNPPAGTHVQHYFSPELTFALPEHKERQLVIRLHHRSGAYGVISGAMSAATYITVGFRYWF
jgi:hypothetical protein